MSGEELLSNQSKNHAKPWRDSTNDDRLDGKNGLLLTPTIDHLFDCTESLRPMGVDPAVPISEITRQHGKTGEFPQIRW